MLGVNHGATGVACFQTFCLALTLAQRRLCAAAILARLFADIVRLGVVTKPVSLAQRAL